MRVYACGCIYNGISSDKMGLILCTFDGNGLETTSAGSKIDLVSQKLSNRDKQYLYSSNYNEVLTFTLQFIKKDQSEMLRHELIEYGRWLQHRQYKPFQFTNCNFADIRFYAVATEMNELVVGGRTYGIEVVMSTNAPYGFAKEATKTISLSSTPFQYINQSEEYGYIYPNMKITVHGTGDLTITNDFENRETKITGCSAGEVIILDGDKKTISSNHQKDLESRFNWKWLRFCRSEDGNINPIYSSIPCTVEFTYQNVKKVGVS